MLRSLSLVLIFVSLLSTQATPPPQHEGGSLPVEPPFLNTGPTIHNIAHGTTDESEEISKGCVRKYRFDMLRTGGAIARIKVGVTPLYEGDCSQITQEKPFYFHSLKNVSVNGVVLYSYGDEETGFRLADSGLNAAKPIERNGKQVTAYPWVVFFQGKTYTISKLVDDERADLRFRAKK